MSRLPFFHGADGVQIVLGLIGAMVFLWALHELQQIRYESRIERNRPDPEDPS